ncbi:MAG: hypothetical protein AB1649_13530 [Chloroflexota bacterium]
MVPDSISLHRLHTILQIVMGWTNSHLHQFIIDDELYGEPETSRTRRNGGRIRRGFRP